MLFSYKNVFLSEFLEYLLIKPTALQELHNKAVEVFLHRKDMIISQTNKIISEYFQQKTRFIVDYLFSCSDFFYLEQ